MRSLQLDCSSSGTRAGAVAATAARVLLQAPPSGGSSIYAQPAGATWDVSRVGAHRRQGEGARAVARVCSASTRSATLSHASQPCILECWCSSSCGPHACRAGCAAACSSKSRGAPPLAGAVPTEARVRRRQAQHRRPAAAAAACPPGLPTHPSARHPARCRLDRAPRLG